MRVVVFSDTHGYITKCAKVIDSIKNIDMIIHLGDVLRDVEDLKNLYPNIPIEYIKGNNDFFAQGPKEKIITLQDKKIWITHGHLYRVKYEYQTILEKAKERKVDGVLFGHTHEAYYKQYDDIFMLNPGSTTIPTSGEPSYGVIEIEDGKLGVSICPV